MSFSASVVVPFTHACFNLSELADFLDSTAGNIYAAYASLAAISKLWVSFDFVGIWLN
jgi:hypothetical protein